MAKKIYIFFTVAIIIATPIILHILLTNTKYKCVDSRCEPCDSGDNCNLSQDDCESSCDTSNTVRFFPLNND